MIALGSDHGGFDLKCEIIEHLKERGLEYKDFGCMDKSSCDYPEFGRAAALAVASGECDRGIVVCTTGIGISIAANKVKGIRCARVTTVEDAHHAKNHNGANVIAFGGIPFDLAKDIVNTFIETESPLEERHLRRINKIIKYEE